MNAVDGSNQVDLSNNSAADSRPAWSPDGAKVAFDSKRTGNSEIFTMDANGANQIDVTNSSATDQRPDWQPLAPGQKVMTVSDSGFSAAMVTVKRGDRLEWDFAGAASHTATDSSGMNLFGSGSMPAGGTYGFGFCAAATYGVVDALNTSNTATVQVPISV